MFEQTKLHAFARYIGPSPAPEPPYKPIKPCPYKPESLDKCVAEAKAAQERARERDHAMALEQQRLAQKNQALQDENAQLALRGSVQAGDLALKLQVRDR